MDDGYPANMIDPGAREEAAEALAGFSDIQVNYTGALANAFLVPCGGVSYSHTASGTGTKTTKKTALQVCFFGNESGLLTLAFPDLAVCTGAITLPDMVALTSLDLSALEFANSIGNTASLDALTTLNLPALKALAGAFSLSNAAALASLSFPALKVALNVTSLNLSALTAFSAPVLECMVGSFSPQNWNAFTGTLSLPELKSVGQNFSPTVMFNMAGISTPKLAYVGASYAPANIQNLSTLNHDLLAFVGVNYAPVTMNRLTTLSSPALVTVLGNYSPGSMAVCTTITAAALVTVGGVFNPNAMPLCTGVDFGSLATVGGTFSPALAGVTALAYPALATVGGSFTPSGAAATAVNFSALQNVGMLVPNANGIGGNYAPSGIPLVATWNNAALQNVGGLYNPSNMAALTSMTNPVLVSVGAGVTINTGITNLATFSLGTASTLKNIGGNVTITGQKLTAASVEAILVPLAALDGTNGTTLWGTGRTVNLSGGTSSGVAGLTGPAATARTALLARGCTVTLNA